MERLRSFSEYGTLGKRVLVRLLKGRDWKLLFSLLPYSTRFKSITAKPREE
jgi:hypothetical protein